MSDEPVAGRAVKIVFMPAAIFIFTKIVAKGVA
jgi:hypothetical protein